MWWCRCVCEYDCVSLCIYNCEGIECVFYSLQLHSELSTSLRFLLKMTSLKNKLPNLVDWRELREKPFFSIKKLKSIVKSMCNYVGWFVELHKIFASFSVFLLAFFIQRFAHHKSFFHCQNGVYHILFSAMDHCFWFFFVKCTNSSSNTRFSVQTLHNNVLCRLQWLFFSSHWFIWKGGEQIWLIN